ncbi:hypothetical protein, partial [Burkholderia cenocepacia]
TELRKYVPDLVLVGGAVRDVYFKRPVKDLDFMTCDDQAARILSEYYGEPLTRCITVSDEEYEGDAGDTMIAAYENAGKTINVLHVSNQIQHIAMFPDTLSQVWTDGERVYASAKFNGGIPSKTAFYTERMTDERLGRLRSKYQDFTFLPPLSARMGERA